jgi:hypothetical protein
MRARKGYTRVYTVLLAIHTVSKPREVPALTGLGSAASPDTTRHCSLVMGHLSRRSFTSTALADLPRK